MFEKKVTKKLGLFSGSFREFFGKITGFPIPGFTPEGIIFFRKNSAELRGSCAGCARYLRGSFAVFLKAVTIVLIITGNKPFSPLWSILSGIENFLGILPIPGYFRGRKKTRNSAGIIPANYGISARNKTLSHSELSNRIFFSSKIPNILKVIVEN